jgi:ribonuclease HI
VAEVLAVLVGIELAHESAPTTVVSDSQYAVYGLTHRRADWQAKAAKGKHPANYELLCHAVQVLAQKPNVSLRWEKGHRGHPGNQGADYHAWRLAEEARKAAEHKGRS